MFWSLKHPQIAYQKADTPTWTATTKVKSDIAALLEIWRQYVSIPHRKYIIDDAEHVCYIWNVSKQIDSMQHYWDTRNTIARELTLRIKTEKSPLLASHKSVLMFEHLVLLYACSESKRRAIKQLKMKYHAFFKDIENWSMSEILEDTAKEFYTEFKARIGLNGKAEDLLHSFSWAGEDKYSKFEYCCHSWMIIMCIIGLINLGKD